MFEWWLYEIGSQSAVRSALTALLESIAVTFASTGRAASCRVASYGNVSCRVATYSVVSAGARGEQPTSVKTNYVKCMLRFQRLLIIKCFIVFNKI